MENAAQMARKGGENVRLTPARPFSHVPGRMYTQKRELQPIARLCPPLFAVRQRERGNRWKAFTQCAGLARDPPPRSPPVSKASDQRQECALLAGIAEIYRNMRELSGRSMKEPCCILGL